MARNRMSMQKQNKTPKHFKNHSVLVHWDFTWNVVTKHFVEKKEKKGPD